MYLLTKVFNKKENWYCRSEDLPDKFWKDSEFPQTDLHFVQPSQEPTTVVVHSKSNQLDVETSRTNQLLRRLQDVIAVLEVVVDVK